jgi:hypothetical protein
LELNCMERCLAILQACMLIHLRGTLSKTALAVFQHAKYSIFRYICVRLRDAVMDGARLEIDNLSRTQRSAQIDNNLFTLCQKKMLALA